MALQRRLFDTAARGYYAGVVAAEGGNTGYGGFQLVMGVPQ